MRLTSCAVFCILLLFLTPSPSLGGWTNLSVPAGPAHHPAVQWPGSAATATMLYVMGGTVNNGFYNRLSAFDLNLKTWTDLSTPSSGNPPTVRAGPQIQLYNGKLYLYGGFYGKSSYVHSHAYTDVHVYDIAAASWTDLRASTSGPKPAGASMAQMAEARGKLYVFGGKAPARTLCTCRGTTTVVDVSVCPFIPPPFAGASGNIFFSDTPLNGIVQPGTQSIGIMTQGADIQVRMTRDGGGLQPCPGPAWFSNAPQLCYLSVNDPADEFWDCREALRTTCGDRTLCDVTSVVDDGSDLNQLFEFDIASSVWTDLSTPLGGSLPVARSRHAMAATDCKLFVFGGTTLIAGGAETDDFYEYDIAARTWTDWSPGVPPKRSSMGFVGWCNKVWLFSGYDNDQVPPVLLDFWSYDVASQTWMDLSATSGTFPALVAHDMTVTTTGTLVVFGGAGGDGAFNNDVHSFDTQASCPVPPASCSQTSTATTAVATTPILSESSCTDAVEVVDFAPPTFYCDSNGQWIADCSVGPCTSCLASPASALDGDAATLWNPQGSGGTVCSLTLDLGAEVDVLGVRWTVFGDGAHDRNTLQSSTSADGGLSFILHDTAALPTGTRLVHTVAFSSTATTRYLKLSATGGSFQLYLPEVSVDFARPCPSDPSRAFLGPNVTGTPAPTLATLAPTTVTVTALVPSTPAPTLATLASTTVTVTALVPSTTSVLDANNSACFEQSVGVALACGIPPVVVRCRAASQQDFEAFLRGTQLPVPGPAEGPGLPVANMLASCEGWFEWACGSVGLALRRAQQCEAVCKLVDGGVREALGSGCEVPHNCRPEALRPYTCSKEAEYLLWSSCDFGGNAIAPAVQRRITSFTSPYPDGAELCYGSDAIVEGGALVNVGTPPLNVGNYVQEHPQCRNGNECRFACMNQDWTVLRTHDRLEVTFSYVGPCECPELTSQRVVYNTVGPPGDVTWPVAARLSGTHMGAAFSATLFPIAASNQVLAQMRFGSDRCYFSYALARGGFLGLPDPSFLAMSPEAAVDFAGFNARESAEDFRAQAAALVARFLASAGDAAAVRRTVGAHFERDNGVSEGMRGFGRSARTGSERELWPGSEHDHGHDSLGVQRAREHAGLRALGVPVEHDGDDSEGRGLRATQLEGSSEAILSYLGDSCPQSGEECVFACVSAGFRAEVYGSYVLFVAEYDGLQCDCAHVFKAPPQPDLVTPTELEAAFMVGSIQGGGSNAIVRLASLEMLPRAAVEQNISLTLSADARRGTDDTITLDIGPGLCAYTFKVSEGVVLGLEAPAIRANEPEQAADNQDVVQETIEIPPTRQDAIPPPEPEQDVDSQTPDTSETQQVTEVQAKRAADATLGGIVAGVAIGVGASVVGGVTSALGGSASASASSGAANGNAATGLLFQAQFLAVAGRIGGPNGQPQSTRDMWSGLGFLNWHMFTLYESDENAAVGRTSDNTQNRGQKRAGTAQIVSEPTWCAAIEKTPGELGGTVLSAIVGIVVVFLCRSLLQRGVWWIQDRKGLPRGDPVPFPCWEIGLYLSQFTGLAESAGDAISSNCLRYEVGGALVLLILGLSVFAFVAIVFWAIRKGKAVWAGTSVRETWVAVKEQWAEAKARPSLGRRLQGYYDAYQLMYTRGDWEQHEHTAGAHHMHSSFVDKFGSVFDGNHGMGWWYGFWLLSKFIVLGTVVSSVWEPVTNATTVLVLYVVDVVLHIVFHPDNEWNELLKNVYSGLMNISVAAAVLAYLDFGISLQRFRDLFRILSLASIIPLVFGAVLGPLFALLLKGAAWVQWCRGFLAGGGGAAAGVVGQSFVAAQGNLDYDTLAAVESDLAVTVSDNDHAAEQDNARSSHPPEIMLADEGGPATRTHSVAPHMEPPPLTGGRHGYVSDYTA